MDKNELIKIVTDVCGVSEHDFHHTKKAKASYARTILYKYYSEQGLTHEAVAKEMNRTRSCISAQLKDFYMRLKFDKELDSLYRTFKERINHTI